MKHTLQSTFRLITATLVLSISLLAHAQDTKVRFFGQPGFDYTRSQKSGQSASNFIGNNFVMFITSQIDERISILSETNFKLNYQDSSQSTFGVDIERLMVRYYINDYISVRFGRMYTPIGFWNNQFNLGLVLQPTISRPRVILAEHEGGILQTRDGGLQIEGNNITPIRISYKLMIANGLGRFGVRATTHGLAYDNTRFNTFATYFNLMIEPVDNLKIFGSASYDEIKSGFRYRGFSPTSTLYAKLFNGGVAYFSPDRKPELSAEYYFATTKDSFFGKTNAQGAFIYAGYRFSDKWTSYGVFDYTDYSDFFITSVNSVKAGLRYKFNASAIVKFEYEVATSYEIRPEPTFLSDPVTGVPVIGPTGGPIITGYKRVKVDNGIYHGPRFQFAFAF